MTDAQAEKVVVAKKHRIGMYCATSTSKQALASVQQWQQQDGSPPNSVEWVFHIPAGCRQATSISAVSPYHEDEVLIVPYSAIFVTKKEVSSISPLKITITANVLPDSMDEDEGLPTVLA